ncbi:hypothetical protein [Peribacillus loiseleuriae]|nr:hypothetical protein [Peribacillus loiseleuriae]
MFELILVFLFLAILIIFLFDFARFRQQNQIIIEQNDKVIFLLEEIKNK